MLLAGRPSVHRLPAPRTPEPPTSATMPPVGVLEKASWSWVMDPSLASPDDIMDQHVRMAYWLQSGPCSRSCQKNCRDNPYCLCEVGHKGWLNGTKKTGKGFRCNLYVCRGALAVAESRLLTVSHLLRRTAAIKKLSSLAAEASRTQVGRRALMKRWPWAVPAPNSNFCIHPCTHMSGRP